MINVRIQRISSPVRDVFSGRNSLGKVMRELYQYVKGMIEVQSVECLGFISQGESMKLE